MKGDALNIAIVRLLQSGLDRRAIAERLGCSYSLVVKIGARENRVAARDGGGR